MIKKFFKKIRYYFLLFYQSIFRYNYNRERYQNSFLLENPKKLDIDCLAFPRVIYVFWTGNNEMSENRKKGLESLIKNSKIEVKLITTQNLDTYILNDYPLHPAFEYLSLVHKSDYLRCYFMHHHGGGYSDVKRCANSWVEAFDIFEKSDKWILGYREIKRRSLAQVEGNIGKDMKKHFLYIIGNCAYICRPKTTFTNEWYQELNKRLDTYYMKLKQHPGNVLGNNEGYPIPWTNILGDIFHPLCLKYMEKLYYSNIVQPIFKNHR